MTRFNTGYRNKTGMLFNSGTRNIMGNGKIKNFSIAFEVIEAFTENKRGYQYPNMSIDEKKTFDVLAGFKLSWMIPLTGKTENKYHYN